MNKDKKRDQKASEKHAHSLAKHEAKAINENPDGFSKKSKSDGKVKPGAPVMNRRQKQKVSDLIKQLRVSSLMSYPSLDKLQSPFNEETRSEERRKAQAC